MTIDRFIWRTVNGRLVAHSVCPPAPKPIYSTQASVPVNTGYSESVTTLVSVPRISIQSRSAEPARSYAMTWSNQDHKPDPAGVDRIRSIHARMIREGRWKDYGGVQI